jgi:hypothetical protein
MSFKKSTEKYIQEATIKHKGLYSYEKTEYINNKSSIDIICLKHGIFKQNAKSHLSGRGCPKCFGTPKLTIDKFIAKSIAKHQDRYDYSLITEYKGNKVKVSIRCRIHNEFFWQTPNSHMRGQGCPICRESSGEAIISNILIQKKINFKRQFKINTCKNIRALPFDFAIFDNNNNLKLLIEFQGQQHYRGDAFNFSKPDSLEKIQKRDKIKVDFCEVNKIPLLIIPYYEKDNIASIIETKFENSMIKHLCYEYNELQYNFQL